MIAVLHIVTLFKLFQVRRADIEWYIGEDELPPYCEMTLKAASAERQRGDLQFCATLKETEMSPIMIKRTYEPLSANTHPERKTLGRFQRIWSTKTRNSKIACDEMLAS